MSAETPSAFTVAVPESAARTMTAICKKKGMSQEQVGAVMIYFCCRLLEDGGVQANMDLLADLDFGKGLRQQTERRLDQLLAVAEKTLLDSQGLQRALRSRLIQEET